jgi:hypothetical protein
MRIDSSTRLLWLPIAALTLLVLLVFGDLLAARGGAVPTGHDVETHGRLLDFTATHLRRGEVPLWNPHVFSGTPALGNPSAMALYPPSLLAVFLPLPLAITVMTIGHVLLVGVSFHFWMARHGLHPLACLLGAAMVGFGAPFFARIYAGHLSALAAMAWAPLFLLATEELLRAPSRRWLALGAASLAMQALGGHIQFVVYTLIVAAGLVLLRLPRVHARTRTAVALALMLLLGSAVAAAPLTAIVAALREGSRGGGLSFAFFAQHSMQWSGFLAAVAPGFFGQPSGASYWGPWLGWEVSPYVGVAGLALAIQGALQGSFSLRGFAIAGCLASLVLALGDGTPLLRILYALGPPFDGFRAPGRALFVFSLFAAMLAAAGLDALVRKRSPNAVLIGVLLGAAGALLALALWIPSASRGDVTGVRAGIERMLAAAPDRRASEIERLAGGNRAWAGRLAQVADAADDRRRASGEESEEAAFRRYEAAFVAATDVNAWQAMRSRLVDINTLLTPIESWADPEAAQRQAAGSARSAGCAAAACAVVAMLLWWSRRSGWAPLLLGALGVLELAGFAWMARGTFDLSPAALRPLETFYGRRSGDYRVHNTTSPNSAMSLGVRDIWGRDAAASARYTRYVAFTQGSAATDARAPFLDLWRVDPSYRMLRLAYVLRDDGDAVRVLMEQPNPLPRLLLIGDYVVRSPPDEMLETLTSASWDPAKTVILEAEPDPVPARGVAQGSARVLDEGTDRLTIEADLPAAALLLVTDAYSVDWHARALPGSVQPAYRVVPANYVLRGVPLSAGRHRLELWYAPPYFRWAVGVSALALCCLVVLLAYR